MDITYYTTYDLPIPYRNIMLYPITVKDYFQMNTFSQCFTIDKNSIPNKKIISMTNLEYLFYTAQENIEKEPYLLWFDRMLALCVKDDDTFGSIEKSISRYLRDTNGDSIFMIKNEKYTYEDYENLKQIICEQNAIELPDITISKEVRDSLEKAKKYKSKLAGNQPASLEDYILSLSLVTGWTLEYIYGMSIRKFLRSITRYDNLIHYKIYLAASMSGMVEFKDKSFIKHWLTNLDAEDKYDNVSMNLDAIQEKISLESAK